jgi:hypothetical protein
MKKKEEKKETGVERKTLLSRRGFVEFFQIFISVMARTQGTEKTICCNVAAPAAPDALRIFFVFC